MIDMPEALIVAILIYSHFAAAFLGMGLYEWAGSGEKNSIYTVITGLLLFSLFWPIAAIKIYKELKK